MMRVPFIFRFLFATSVTCIGTLGWSPVTTAADIAFVWGNQPAAASYTPDANYTYNAGQPVTITRSETGQYAVRFGRVAGPGANVQVTAYGPAPGHCNVKNWSAGTVNIICFDGNNQLADRQFTVLAIKGAPEDTSQLAYAWLSNASQANYTANSTYRFGNGSFAIARSQAGQYRITLGTVAGQEAAVLSTGYGGRIHCSTVNWSTSNANLACNNTDGSAFDSQASVLAIKKGFPNASFVWNSSSQGRLNPLYSEASDGSTQSVTRLSVGRYRVRLGPEATVGGHIQVSAYRSPGTCWVQSWDNSNVNIRCAKGGQPFDSRFVVLGLAKQTLLFPNLPISGAHDASKTNNE